MLRKEENRQTQKEEFCVENFVPKDRLLRKIEEAVDFSYIYESIDGRPDTAFCNGQLQLPSSFHRWKSPNPFFTELKKKKMCYSQHNKKVIKHTLCWEWTKSRFYVIIEEKS